MAKFIYDIKKVHYTIKGKGKPILMIHGNTMSSKMFSTILKKYTQNFKVVLVDLPGHGKSEYIPKFKTDFWHYNSLVCIELVKKLKLKKVSVIGTSGGALIALNMALEAPELVDLVVADSFEGEFPLESYIDNLKKDREKDKRKFLAKLIWFYMHGFRWKKVVDADTQINIDFYKSGNSFFHQPISGLNMPVYFTGSREDEYCSHLEMIYSKLAEKNKNIKIHMFEKGYHPAMISNKNDFFNLVQTTIKK